MPITIVVEVPPRLLERLERHASNRLKVPTLIKQSLEYYFGWHERIDKNTDFAKRMGRYAGGSGLTPAERELYGWPAM